MICVEVRVYRGGVVGLFAGWWGLGGYWVGNGRLGME